MQRPHWAAKLLDDRTKILDLNVDIASCQADALRCPGETFVLAIQPTVWGVHMGWHVDNRPIEQSYVAIGWPNLGDLRNYPDREAFKAALAAHAAEGQAGAVPVQAGVLFRFVHEMKPGDVVVYPSKHDRTVNIGRFTGETSYVEGDQDEYPRADGNP